MNKKFYTFTVFLLTLSVVCGLLQSLICLVMGTGIYYSLSAIVSWLIWVSVIAIACSVCLLKYLYHRKYWLAFYAGAFALITSLCYHYVFFMALISKHVAAYYRPVVMVYLCSGLVYALSLIISVKRKDIWLKMSGIPGLVLGAMLLSINIWSISISPDISEKIMVWAGILAIATPMLLIVHFKTETKLLKIDQADIPIQDHIDGLGFVRIIACLITIPLGLLLTYQCAMQQHWGEKNFEYTKALARLFEPRVFVNSKGDTLRYRLLKPLNYDPGKRYPLVISLPYGGQPGTDTIRQLEGAAAAEVLSTDSNRKKHPAFIFVPNCPSGSGWGGIPNYPSVDTLVYKAISALDTAFSIDPNRRYVTGISRGGYGTWHFICTRPDLFAAAIPVCGGEDPTLASKIVNVAVWAFHGAQDQNVPVAGSRGMIAGMKKTGQTPRYTEYPDMGHNIWYKVSTTPGLWDWLFAQRRK